MKDLNKTIASTNFSEISSTNSLTEKLFDNNQNPSSKLVLEKTSNCLSTSEISFLKVLIGLNIQRI